MKKQCNSSFDRITELPSSISQIILMCLPLRDMARTSVLSKHWRYQWVNVPQLVFKDDPMYCVLREERYRYNAKKVFEILFQRHGPLLKLTLDMAAWLDCSAVNKIIPFLSRNGIKELTLLMPKGECYTLPSSILSCVGQRKISLSSCVFTPLTFAGFSKLVSLKLMRAKLDSNVSISSCPLLESLVLEIHTIVNLLSIDAPNLKMLDLAAVIISQIGVMNTPLLKDLRLSSSFDSISFIHSLHLLEKLRVSYKYHRFHQVMALRDCPNKALKSLNNLSMLKVLAYFRHMDELSSTLRFIRSSPNLQKLKFSLRGIMLSLIEAGLYLKNQEHSNYSLLKLQEVEIILNGSCDLGFVIEFSKFLLDISPVLRILYFQPDLKLIDVNGCKMLLELACYPRASPRAKIVFAGLGSLNLTIS